MLQMLKMQVSNKKLQKYLVANNFIVTFASSNMDKVIFKSM